MYGERHNNEDLRLPLKENPNTVRRSDRATLVVGVNPKARCRLKDVAPLP